MGELGSGLGVHAGSSVCSEFPWWAGCFLDEKVFPPRSKTPSPGPEGRVGEDVQFPPEILQVIGDSPGLSPEMAWEGFLAAYGDLLLRTARYVHRGHDASMDAYAFILEKLRQDDFRRLRAFPGGDEGALTRWLVVVARRLCSDFRRHRYGRVRPTTSELDRETRRRLVDEIWDPRQSSELPADKASNPEWELRFSERRKALESSLGGLAPKDRLLLAFRFEDGLSARRISQLMDYPTPFHVYRHLNRVLAGLRKRLEELGFDCSDP